MIMQNHINQRLIDPDATAVFNKAELAKAIHEETDAGAGGADHLCQSLLRDGRGQMEPTQARERRLSNEFPGGEQRDRGLLAVGRNDREFRSARPKIEDGVSRASRKKKTRSGCEWTTFRPTPAFSRKVARSKVMLLTPDN
jgi:hypothetical protein